MTIAVQEPLPLRARLLRRLRVLSSVRGWGRACDMILPRAAGARYGFDVDFFGARYIGDLGTMIDRRVFFDGAYERSYLNLISALVHPDRRRAALDVGANEGHHALFFASLFSEVYAFEPNPFLHERFLERVRASGRANIHLERVGLWNKAEVLTFHLPTDRNPGMGTFVESEREVIGSPGVVELPVERGDDVVRRLNLTAVDLIKADIQGGEGMALDGLQETLRRFTPMIWFELSRGTQAMMPTYSDLAERLPFETAGLVYLCSNSPLSGTHALRYLTPETYPDIRTDIIVVPKALEDRLAQARHRRF